MEFLNFVSKKFEVAFQKHEKEVVIELAIDRILTFLGVHVLLGLGGLFKVSEVVGDTFDLLKDNVACYPTSTNSTPGRSFVLHAQSFCWESTRTYPGEPEAIQNGKNLLENTVLIKTLFKSLPYIFMAEAALLAVPGAYWNIAVGPRLTGLLTFMLHFLEDVYKSLKNINAGLYRRRPYDKEGNYLDGWRQFRPRYKAEHQGITAGKSKSEKKKKAVLSKLTSPMEIVEALVQGEFSEDEDSDDEQDQATAEDTSKNLYGVTDRQIFSMLCYENFASLSYQPYIMSVEALTSTKSAEGHRRGIVPLKKGILAQLCHKENFSGTYLTKCYMIRYTLNITLGSILTVSSWIIFLGMFLPALRTKAFSCLLPTSGATVVCVLNKHWDITVLYLINAILLTTHLLLSVYQAHFVRYGSNRGMCYFFEDVVDSSSVALQSAATAEQNLKKNEGVIPRA